MIEADKVLKWLLSQKDLSNIPMPSAIAAFTKQIQINTEENKKLFLRYIRQYTENAGEGKLRVKSQYLP